MLLLCSVFIAIHSCIGFSDINMGILPTHETQGQPLPVPSMYDPTDVVINVNDKVFSSFTVCTIDDYDLLYRAYRRYMTLTYDGYI